MILIVEDDHVPQRTYWNRLQEAGVAQGDILQAFTVRAARELFETHQQELKVVIMDGCVPTGDRAVPMTLPPNTRSFIREMLAAGFTGLVVAASSLPQHSELMRGSGANEVQDKTAISHWLPGMLTRVGFEEGTFHAQE